jgi:hypothetical protein
MRLARILVGRFSNPSYLVAACGRVWGSLRRHVTCHTCQGDSTNWHDLVKQVKVRQLTARVPAQWRHTVARLRTEPQDWL